MGIWEDGKEIIKAIDTVRELKGELSKANDRIAELEKKVAVLESREDAIVMTAKESVRQLLENYNRPSIGENQSPRS